jgi:KipI family sensor histidine kinase inhibitor
LIGQEGHPLLFPVHLHPRRYPPHHLGVLLLRTGILESDQLVGDHFAPRRDRQGLQNLVRKYAHMPVVYGGIYGPDLEEVAKYHQISPEEVIQLHCSNPYLIYMIGFMPGYPYMGELPQALVTPRLKTPRLSVPKGSVAIAQRQTGIYSMESPGGWQILGRTPVGLFDPGKDPPALLQMGDFVQFYPISEKEFKEWRTEEATSGFVSPPLRGRG